MSRQSIQAGKAVIVVDVVDRATASFKKMQSGIMNASRSFRDLGTNSAGAALLTGAPIAKGLSNYAKFTDEIQNVEAKLGNFGITSTKVRQNSIELRNEIIKLGRDTAYTSTEVAKAAGVLAQGGLEEFGLGTIKSSLKAIIDLGRGTKLHLDDAANMAISIGTTFKAIKQGMTSNQISANITQIADQIVKAGRLSIAGADDLAASLVYVGQSAADLKANVPEILTLLNALAQAGIKGSVAGTSLNTAFVNLLNNAEKIKEKFPDFNTVLKADGAIDLIETFGKLGKMMKSMSPQGQVQFLADVFNLRGQRAASAFDDLDAMRKGLKQITNSAGEAAQSAQVMMAGFGGVLERLGGAIDKVNIQIGLKFDKQLKGTFEIVTLMIDKIGDLTVKHTALLGVILLSPAIFAVTAAAALTMSFVLARLSTVVGLLIKGFRGLKSVGGIMLGGAKSLASPIAALASSRSVKAAAIKKTSEKIAKLQLALDLSYVKASARKVGAAEAVAKIGASKKQASLIAAVSARNKLQGPGIGATLSRGKAALSGAGSSIANRIRAVATAVAERKEIKGQVGLERLLSAQQVKKNRLLLAAVKDSPVNEAKRLAKIVELNKASNVAKQKALQLNKLAAVEGKKILELEKLKKNMEVPGLLKQRADIRNTPRSRNPVVNASLKTREAELTVKINKSAAVRQQIGAKIVDSQKKITSLQTQSVKSSKLSTTLGARATRNATTLKAVESANFVNKLKRDSITAKSTAQGAASTARISRAGQALKGASIGKALFSGMKLPALGKTIASIAQLTFAFTKLSLGLARFVFSWNFVGLAFNALLLFGHKIPAVNKAFKDVGEGISAAFYQISKIATYAAPALELFSLAIEAFASGNTAIGVRALSTAFQGVVDIIQNQLTAAWAAFSIKVAELWLNITKIGTAIFSVFTTLFKGLGEIFDNAFQGISNRVSGLLGGKGESTFMTGIATIALSLNDFIANFSATVINLQDWGGQFADDIKNIISGRELLKNTVNTVFGSKSQLAVGMYGNKKEIPINPRLKEIENDKLKREKELLATFKKSSGGTPETDRAYNGRIWQKSRKLESSSNMNEEELRKWNNPTLGKNQEQIDEIQRKATEEWNKKLVAAGKKPEPRLTEKDPNKQAVTDANNASQGSSNIMENTLEQLKAEFAKIIATQAAAAQAATNKQPFVQNNQQGGTIDNKEKIKAIDEKLSTLYQEERKRVDKYEELGASSKTAETDAAYITKKASFMNKEEELTSQRRDLALQEGKPLIQNNQQGGTGNNPIQKFMSKLEVLVGSVGETRAKYKVDSEKTMVDIAKEQLEETKGLRQDFKTAGMM